MSSSEIQTPTVSTNDYPEFCNLSPRFPKPWASRCFFWQGSNAQTTTLTYKMLPPYVHQKLGTIQSNSCSGVASPPDHVLLSFNPALSFSHKPCFRFQFQHPSWYKSQSLQRVCPLWVIILWHLPPFALPPGPPTKASISGDYPSQHSTHLQVPQPSRQHERQPQLGIKIQKHVTKIPELPSENSKKPNDPPVTKPRKLGPLLILIEVLCGGKFHQTLSSHTSIWSNGLQKPKNLQFTHDEGFVKIFSTTHKIHPKPRSTDTQASKSTTWVECTPF